LFPDYNGTADKRAQFYQNGQNLEIADQTQFTNGFAVTKYRNVKSGGGAGSSLEYADVDFPIFRLAEMYLVYAEAVVRGGTGGDVNTAVGYINLLRQRAYGDNTGNITAGQLTENFILDERGRELYWEGHRRTDLVRYNRFTTDTYLWPWKGGAPAGAGVSDDRNVFPIPSQDMLSNPNLVQNDGY
jgi:starch-binding outer membrane protein, SusD/RagB family